MGVDKVFSIMYEHYGINASKVEIINRLFLRQSFLVYNQEEKFVFKKYPRTYEEIQLNCIWDFAKYLNDYGMVTMELINKNDGERFYKNVNEYFVLYKYICGSKAMISNSYEIGKLLKEFHILSKKIKLKVMREFKLKRDATEACANMQKYLLYDSNTSLSKKIADNIDVLLRAIEQYVIKDNIIVHGDFTLNNVINRGTSFCIIDMDTIRLGNAVEDMACFVLSLCYTNERDLKLIPKYKEIFAFLKGYYGDKKISDSIIDEIVDNIKIHCAYELAGQASNYMIAKRYTGTEAYLNMLADAVISDGFGLKIGLKNFLRSEG